MIHLSKKNKIILCLKFYCSSLFTNDSAILCFFFPPNLPTLLTALVWPVLGQKEKMSVLLLWSQFIIMIKIHETFNQNQLFCLPYLTRLTWMIHVSFFTLKMVSVFKNIIFGQKMMVKSGVEIIFLKHLGGHFTSQKFTKLQIQYQK